MRAPPSGVGRTRLMDTRGDRGADHSPGAGSLPEYRVIDDSELRLVIPATGSAGP